jgi:zinc protease
MVRSLDNGLTAVLVESHASPVVALQIWVKVGSADERSDEAGLAHLHEHMLFKGTDRRGAGEIAREVETRGGEINAWTSFDETVYHLVLAAPFLSVGLDVLADAVRNASFDPEELRRETHVVVEEIKRTEDSPGRRVSRLLFEQAYGRHAYRKPVIGTAESVLGFTREKIVDFYRRHYAPDRMVLAVVGDFAEAELSDEVERVFGDWHARGGAGAKREPEPPQTAPRVALLADGTKESYLSLGFHIPALLDPDLAALELLSAVLGHGESSRLATRLKRRDRLMTSTYAYAYGGKDPGLWVCGGNPGHGNERAALSGLLAEVHAVREGVLEDEEIARAKRMLLAESVYQHETAQGYCRKVGFFQTMAGSLEAEKVYESQLKAVSAEKLREVAERYLSADNATLVGLLTEGESIAVGDAEAELRSKLDGRSLPPTAARASKGSARPHGLEVHPLPGGGSLLFKQETTVPLVAFRAAQVGGLRFETPQNNGITALGARLLTRGAAGRDAEAIAQSIDSMAGSVSGVPGRNSFGLSGEFLSEHLDEALALFLDCLLAPDFPESELSRERQHQLQGIRAREDHPQSLAMELFLKTLFRVHPYRLNLGGEEASVSALGADQVREFFKAHYPPSTVTLSVVGAVEPRQVIELCRRAFERHGLREDSPFAPPAVPVEPRPQTPRFAERKLDKAQVQIVVGFLGGRLLDPDRHTLQLLAALLGGMGGRLFSELRDKQSLCYSVHGASVEALDRGYFAIQLGTSAEKRDRALAGIREQLARVREERVSASELEGAKAHLIGVHAIGLQRRSSLAATVALDQAYGLPPENYLRYAEQITAVDAARLQETAQAYLDPSGEVVAVVGP